MGNYDINLLLGNFILVIALKEEILKLVDLKHDLSEGMCGIPIVCLKLKLGIEIEELNGFLSELYKEKKIVVRKGINGKMLFKKIN